LDVWNRPPAEQLDALLTAGESGTLALAGYSLRGRLARYVLADEDPEVLAGDELRRFLDTLIRRPEVAVALRGLLEAAS
jgi:hypothetical protein